MLLLDEPLGALDLKLREEMQVELKQIQQQVGITFIFVTHDQGEALSMSDRVAVFNQGRIEQVGTPREIYEHPATEFVAGFVGTANLLPDGDGPGHRPTRADPLRRPQPATRPAPTGTIDAVQYLGATTRYRVHTDDGTTLVVEVAQHHGRRPTSRWATPCSWPGSPPTASGGDAAGRVDVSTDSNPRGGNMRRKGHRLAGVAMALALVAAACGDDDDDGDGASDTTAPRSRRDRRGRRRRLDPRLAVLRRGRHPGPELDWVTAFEEDTGCDAEVKYFGTSDEAFTLFGTGDYDVVSASGDSSMRSVASGDAAAINTEPARALRRPGRRS